MIFERAAKIAVIAFFKEKYGKEKYDEAFASLLSRNETLGRGNIVDNKKFFYYMRYFLGEENPARKDMYELLIEILNEKVRNQEAWV